MRLLTTCLLILALFPFQAHAQQTTSVQQGNPAYDLWLVRSQAITDDVIKDITDLKSPDRVLLWAKLAQRWWRENPEKARSWILKAIDIVRDVPNKENPGERRERLAAARALLQIITPLDQELSKQLLSFLIEDIEKAADADRSANADGIIEAAISLASRDPQRAAELGTMALRVGQPNQITSLIFALRRKDRKLADVLFGQALVAAREPLTSEFLNSLTYAAFPEAMQGEANSSWPPDNLRAELLRLDVAFLQVNPINAENRNSICGSIGAFIAPVISHFDRLLPQQAGVVRQSVIQCNSSSPLVRQRMDNSLSQRPLNTVEDLLKAADDAQDMKVRTVYQYRAASMAKEQQELDRAIKILDSMSSEAREFMGGSWEAYRWEWAALLALRHFKSGDVYAMRVVLNAVPADLQPFARLAFVAQLPEKRNKETDPTLEFLSEARAGLRRSSIADAEKCSWYFGLLRLIVKHQPADATAVLKEAVAALNNAAQANDKTGSKEARAAWLESISRNLPATLLELDEYSVKESLAAISAPDVRVQVRLDFLGACLARLRNLKQATPGPAQSPSKEND
jgi:hypothetical protein